MIILDTNVLSELMKPAPEAGVVTWVAALPASGVYTTSITEAEILHGIKLLPAGRKRNKLEDAARAMFVEDFAGRVLSFDSHAARFYAEIAVKRRKVGKPIAGFDAQIATIVKLNDATLATRNIADFEHCGIKLVNPWTVM